MRGKRATHQSLKHLPVAPTVFEYDFAYVVVGVEVACRYDVAFLFYHVQQGVAAATAIVFVGVNASAPVRLLHLHFAMQRIAGYHGLLSLRAYQSHLMARRVARCIQRGHLVGDVVAFVNQVNEAHLLKGDNAVRNLGRGADNVGTGEMLPVQPWHEVARVGEVL